MREFASKIVIWGIIALFDAKVKRKRGQKRPEYLFTALFYRLDFARERVYNIVRDRRRFPACPKENFMKKRFEKVAVAIASVALCAFIMIGCGGYDVTLPIGDGNIENDAVVASFHIDDTISDGYVLKGKFYAESNANLDRKFILSICTADPRMAKSYTEQVIYGFKGSDVDGKELKFEAAFPKLNDFFEKTDEEKKFFIALRVDSEDFGFTECNTSDYTYTFDGTKLKIIK